MKRDKTVLKMICNQWVGSSNLSSGTTLSPNQLDSYYLSRTKFLQHRGYFSPKSNTEILLNYIKNCILCKVS